MEKIFVDIKIALILLFYIQLIYSQKNEITNGTHPVFSPTAVDIAFEHDRRICIMNIEGKKLREISTLSWDFRPSWAPNGLMIAFQSYGTNKTQKDKFAIWLVNSDGSNQRQLITPADDGDQTPKWSRDGKSIVWTHGNQLWVADSSGKNARSLTKDAAKKWEYICGWSPDMRKIVYLRCDTYDSPIPYKIWLMDSDGGNQRILGDGIRALDAKWSADGKYLYYSTGIVVSKVDISSPEKVDSVYSFGFDYHISHFDLSPDEQLIIFDTSGPGIEDEKIVIDKFTVIKK